MTDGPAILADEVTKQFGGLTAVNAVSVTIPRSSIYGIVGPNGAGKTTFLNLVNGILPVTSGAISTLGTDSTGYPAHKVARLGVARTFQTIKLVEGLSVVDTVIAGRYRVRTDTVVSAILALPGERRARRESRERAMQLIESVGLKVPPTRLATSLSYGEQRAARDRAGARVRAGHSAAGRADRRDELQGVGAAGRPADGAPRRRLDPRHGRAQHGAGAPLLHARRGAQLRRPHHRGCAGRVPRRPPSPGGLLWYPLDILTVENLSVAYGGIQAVKGISFAVPEGALVSIIGSNGAGKSTTLNTIAGLLTSGKGSVQFLGREVLGKPASRLVRTGLALVPEGRMVAAPLTVRENLLQSKAAGRLDAAAFGATL